jgi:hypothetical protein
MATMRDIMPAIMRCQPLIFSQQPLLYYLKKAVEKRFWKILSPGAAFFEQFSQF